MSSSSSSEIPAANALDILKAIPGDLPEELLGTLLLLETTTDAIITESHEAGVTVQQLYERQFQGYASHKELREVNAAPGSLFEYVFARRLAVRELFTAPRRTDVNVTPLTAVDLFLLLRLDDIDEKGLDLKPNDPIYRVWSRTRGDITAIRVMELVNKTATDENANVLAARIEEVTRSLAGSLYSNIKWWLQNTTARSLEQVFIANPQVPRRDASGKLMTQLPVNEILVRSVAEKPIEWKYADNWRAKYGIGDFDSLDTLESRIELSLERGEDQPVVQVEVVRMIEATLFAASLTEAAPFAAKIYEEITQNKTPIPGSSAKLLTYSTIVRLANNFIPQLNHTDIFSDEPAHPLEVSFSSVPEAFRRLMLVAYAGSEKLDPKNGLQLVRRFEIADMAIEAGKSILETPQSTVSGHSGKTAVRGALPNKGKTYWNRWKAGYGAIS